MNVELGIFMSFTKIQAHFLQIERADMHCLVIAFARLFDMGLASAEYQHLDSFESTPNKSFKSTMKI